MHRNSRTPASLPRAGVSFARIACALVFVSACTVDESAHSAGPVLNPAIWPSRLVDTARIDNAFLWSGITSMLREPDGELLIADVGRSGIVRLDPDGDPTPVHGRRGFGPAEYQSIKWIGRCDESTLVIYDPARDQLSPLSNALQVDEVYSVPASVRSQDVAGCLPNRRIMFAAEPGRIVAFGAQQVPLLAIAWTLGTGALDTILTYPDVRCSSASSTRRRSASRSGDARYWRCSAASRSPFATTATRS